MATEFMKKTSERREQALGILKELLRNLKGITADIFYAALREADFGENEAVRFTGAVMRTASAKGLMEKTIYSQPSQRNSSNLQYVWLSHLYEDSEMSNMVWEYWHDKGFKMPQHEASQWELRNRFLPLKEKYFGTVSKEEDKSP